MFRNFIRVAFRNIVKHRIYAFINILGLTGGLTACFLIALYVGDEISYDRFHSDGENIYRIGLHGMIAEQEIFTANSSPPLRMALLEEIPGVEDATRVRNAGEIVFRYEDKAFVEDRLLYADSNFFQFFSFKLLSGDIVNVLKEPNTLVLTQSMAAKYFEGTDPLGQIIIVGNSNQSYKVTGIAEDTPGNSHIKFDAILSMSSTNQNNGWTSNFLFSYYRKNPQTVVADIDAKLDELVKLHVGAEIEQFMGMTFDQFLAQGNIYGYFSYPMYDTHLRSTYLGDDMEANSDINYVYIFSAIGLFILLIACVNFMNLATAKSAGRAREVGMRKALGSYRSSLIGQFLAESTIYSLVSMTLALVISFILLPRFNTISGKSLEFANVFTPTNITVIFIFMVLVGVVAGSYPAFYLTSFSPSDVLRGRVRMGMKSKGVRSLLVVFQFWISIVLIICTAIVYNQLQYMQSRNLGFDKSNVLVISNLSRLDNEMLSFKTNLLSESQVISASMTNNVFPGVNNTTVYRDAHSDQDHILGSYFADYDHAEVLNFEIKHGRFFSRDFPSDSTAVLINEAALNEIGWKEPLGNELVSFFEDTPQRLKVIGVLRDFNFENLKTKIRPMVIRLTDRADNLLVRYSGSPGEVIERTSQIWSEMSSGEPFEYAFLDQNYDQLFRAEQRLTTIFTVFTILAIFIACLGLFGLASFMAEQRTKEIGIRKVMGATTLGLTGLMSKDFARLVLIAFLLAVGPAYYLMNRWIQEFVYRQELSPVLFIVAGVMALAVASLTVSFQAFKVAAGNPVRSLKYE